MTNELNFFSSYCQTPNQHITEHSNGTYFIKFFLYFFFFVFFELQLYKEIAFKRVLTSIGVSQKGFVLHIVAFFTTNNIKANTIVLVLAAIKYVACFLEFYFMQTCIYWLYMYYGMYIYIYICMYVCHKVIFTQWITNNDK